MRNRPATRKGVTPVGQAAAMTATLATPGDSDTARASANASAGMTSNLSPVSASPARKLPRKP